MVMAKEGRLSYSTKLVDQICARLELGETLSDICSDPPWPKVSTVQHWIQNSFDVRDRFARAREAGEDAIAARTRAIARGVDRVQDFKPGSSEQRDKLVVDTDLRLLAFWNPKKYSERKQMDLNVTIDTCNLFEKQEAKRLEAMRQMIDVTPATVSNEDDPLW